MADKLLTVSVAAYNISRYLEECLDSCLVEGCEALEVIVVNDGSMDDTAGIAQSFVDKRPDVFTLVNQENGGYGTTVNRAIELATGKYFTLLDGDDRFDKQGLAELLRVLRGEDSDLILTKYSQLCEAELTKRPANWAAYVGGQIDLRGEVPVLLRDGVETPLSDVAPLSFQMSRWECIVATPLVKRYMPKLPKHTLYTDQLLVCATLSHVEKIACYDIDVYQYRIGRDGQSMDMGVMKKHYQDQLRMFDVVLETIPNETITGAQLAFWQERFWGYYRFFLRHTFIQPDNKLGYEELRKVERLIKARAPWLYEYMGERAKKMLPLLRSTGYLAYWPVKIAGVVERTGVWG